MTMCFRAVLECQCLGRWVVSSGSLTQTDMFLASRVLSALHVCVRLRFGVIFVHRNADLQLSLLGNNLPSRGNPWVIFTVDGVPGHSSHNPGTCCFSSTLLLDTACKFSELSDLRGKKPWTFWLPHLIEKAQRVLKAAWRVGQLLCISEFILGLTFLVNVLVHLLSTCWRPHSGAHSSSV